MIRVFIERQVPTELDQAYNDLARENLQTAMSTAGFISGEVLHDITDSEKRLIVATYRTLSDWSRWYHSEERRSLMDRIGPMLQREEKISIYEL
jgi:heme-degrading monooxygenase HmoA